MEGAKQPRVNFFGVCPKCKALIRISVELQAELLQQEQREKEAKEEEEHAENKQGRGAGAAEGDSVRPNRKKGKPGTAGPADKPAASEAAAGNQGTGGEQ